MLVDRAENQADNLAPICSFPRKIRRGFRGGLQHKRSVGEAKGPHAAHVRAPHRSMAGVTRLAGCAGTTGTFQPQCMRQSDTSSKGLIS